MRKIFLGEGNMFVDLFIEYFDLEIVQLSRVTGCS